MRIPYLDFVPDLADPVDLAQHAAVAGRTTAGAGLVLRPYATLRADGEAIRVGRNAFFGERASVHIAHGLLSTTIGDDVTVGRFGLVHACTLEQGVVVADGATVMDGSVIGPFALIAAGALVPPRKQLPGGFVYAGNPASPLREIPRDELAMVAHALRTGGRSTLGTFDDLPPLDPAPFLPEGPFEGVLHAVHGRAPAVGRAYVAPTAVVAGDVELHDDSGTFFGCVIAGGGARVVVGEESNVQDNSLIVTDGKRGDVVIGRRVTIGHNVRMGAGRFGDGALVGMASKVADGVVVEPGGCIAAGAHVEPGTVVKAGWIWAGRPARAFRELKASERDWFAQGVDVYVGYARAYRGERPAA
ncbi:MAG TPA: gamma carbonic anhydrase family protein [Casimicrobiaceae bacterium]|nr:gamma carbonic anhydrase family protein [Casimicrobiaceae bacterium]